MENKPTTRKELRKLKAVWYKKLKAEGFKDLEDLDGNFKNYSYYAGKFQFLYKADPVKWAAKEEYFRQCTVFLNEFTFRSPKQRKMWALHCEGVADVQIAKIMSNAYEKLTRFKVRNRLNQLEHRMLHGRSRAEALREKAATSLQELFRLYAAVCEAQRQVKRKQAEIAKMRRQIAKVDW